MLIDYILDFNCYRCFYIEPLFSIFLKYRHHFYLQSYCSLFCLDNRRCFQFISKDTVSNFVFDKKIYKKRNSFSGRFRRYLLPSRANVVRPHNSQAYVPTNPTVTRSHCHGRSRHPRSHQWRKEPWEPPRPLQSAGYSPATASAAAAGCTGTPNRRISPATALIHIGITLIASRDLVRCLISRHATRAGRRLLPLVPWRLRNSSAASREQRRRKRWCWTWTPARCGARPTTRHCPRSASSSAPPPSTGPAPRWCTGTGATRGRRRGDAASAWRPRSPHASASRAVMWWVLLAC